MALEFTYRIVSETPWAEVVVEPDKAEVVSAGQQLMEAGNHTVAGPVEIDEFTREWTLTFPSLEAWNEYSAAVLSDPTGSLQPGFSAITVAIPS